MESSKTTEALEQLEELLSRPFLSDHEQLALRQLAALQIQAHGLAREGLSSADREVFSLVVSRWLHALTDPDTDFDGLAGAFEVTVGSLSAAIGRDAEASMRNLHAQGVIVLDRGESGSTVSLEPILSQVAHHLTALLYRDFLDRRGRDLRNMAVFYSESLAEDLEELASVIPEDARVAALRKDFEALTAHATPDALLGQWSEIPAALYGYLDELAAIEQRLAILTSHPDTPLANDLQRGSAEKILILSGRFAPLPPTAPARAA